MPEIKDRHFFKPDANFTKRWLATRKGGYTVGQSTQRPGLFETISFSADKTWFWIAAAIELIAVAITIYGGFDKGGKYLAFAIIAVLFFVLMDYVGALWAHKRHWVVQRLRNEKVVTSDLSHDSINRKIKSEKGLVHAGVTFVILSALLKLFALFLVTSLALIFYAIFSILYIIVVYAHLKHTGFYFAERAAQSELDKQYSLFSDSHLEFDTTGNRSVLKLIAPSKGDSTPPFVIESGIKDVSIGKPLVFGDENNAKGEPHRLEMVNDKEYVIVANGLLLDKDIKTLCSGQSIDNQVILSKHCINLQLNQCPIKD